MIIGVDKNQFIGAHGVSNYVKHRQMKSLGAELLPLRIPFGDYILVDEKVREVIERVGGADKVSKKDLIGAIKVSIDTKKDLVELCGNVCQDHERFKRELLKPMAQNDAKLILLIEDGQIDCLEDVYFWRNPRLARSPKATTGPALYKSLRTIRDEYNVDVQFCSGTDTGRRIIELLGGNYG